MRSHRFDPGLVDEAPDTGEQDHVREHDDEREPRDASEFGDLDQNDLAVQGSAERVPAPAREDDAAKPFLGDPCRGQKEREPQIVERTQPGRSLIALRRRRLTVDRIALINRGSVIGRRSRTRRELLVQSAINRIQSFNLLFAHRARPRPEHSA